MRCLLLLLILLAPYSVFSIDDEMLAEALAYCEKNQLTANICAWHKGQLADKRLKATYQIQYNRLTDKKDRARLETAQREWEKYRDANCYYEARGSVEDGGTKFPMEFDLCIERLTDHRTGMIQEFIACDVNGCPE